MGIREGMGSLRSKDRVLIGQAKLWGGQARLYFAVVNHKRKLQLRTVTKVPVDRVPTTTYKLSPFRGSDKVLLRLWLDVSSIHGWLHAGVFPVEESRASAG